MLENIKKISNKVKILLLVSGIVLTFSLPFFGGAFSKNIDIEVCASYFSQISLNHTNTPRQRSALIVEPNNKDSKLVDTSFEFHTLYGSFKEEKAAYVSTVNANRENEVYFQDSRISSNNLAFIFAENGYSNKPYKDAYKHEFYPIQLMFPGVHHDWWYYYSFLYISQTQANNLLDIKGLEHTPENYESLLTTTITLVMNGVEYVWMIEDIYLETNYYYDDVTSVIGEFVFGYNRFPDGFTKQSLYFMCDEDFQNQYFINYAKKTYDSKNYNHKYATYNLKDDFKPDESLLKNALAEKDDTLAIFFSAFSAVIFIVCCAFIIVSGMFKKAKISILLLGVSFAPFIVFKFINLITKSPLFFSSFSTIFNLILQVLFFLFFIISNLVNRTLISRKINES